MKYLVRQILDGFAWCETFIWVGLHCFWVLSKSSPLGVDTPWGALLALLPFLVMMAAGLASLNGRIRETMIRLESVLHWTAGLFQALLLFYVVWQNPMQPFLPLASSMLLWSCGLSFILLANLATQLRERTCAQTFVVASPPLFIFVSLLAWWGMSLWLASGMMWVVFFWTASILLHAVLAPLSLRTERTGTVDKQDRTLWLEPYFLLSVILLVQLRGIYNSGGMGGLEDKYVLYLQDFSSMAFFLGVGLFLLAARFRLIIFTHAAVVALLLFTDKESVWPLAIALGYSISALFQATRKQQGFSYALSCLLMAFVWILGMSGFTFSGMIVHFDQATEVVQMLNRGSLFAVLLLSSALVVEMVYKRSAKPQDSVSVPAVVPARTACSLFFLLLLCIAVIPGAVLLATTAWPPMKMEMPDRITVGKPMGVCHAGYSESAEEYHLLNELGVQSMRIDFHWRRFQPSPGEWNLGLKDNYVDMATKNDTQVIALLDFDNAAVETDPDGKSRDMYIAPADVPLFLEYVRQVVSHYKDRVYAWEIWNEPDIARFWDGPIDEFYVLARQTAEVVREVHGTATLVGPACTGPLGVIMATGIEGMHAKGVLEQVDHPSGHLYVTNPRNYYLEFMKLIGVARRYKHPGSVWITELGAPDGGFYPWCTSDEHLAEHVIKAYTIATSLGIDQIVWYCFRDSALKDQAKEPIDSERFFGLLGPDDQWKPSAHAYSLFSRYCTNSTIRNDLVKVSGALAARQLRTAFYQRETGQSALVLWFEPTLRPWGKARIHIDFGDTNAPPTIHDIGSGYTKGLTNDHIVISEKPVFISFNAGNDSEKIIAIEVLSSPLDALWLLLVVGVLLASLPTGLCIRA